MIHAQGSVKQLALSEGFFSRPLLGLGIIRSSTHKKVNKTFAFVMQKSFPNNGPFQNLAIFV